MYRPVVPPEYAPAECLQLMKQCWAEAAEQRPTFDEIFNQVSTLWILALPRSYPKAGLPKTKYLGSHHIVKGISCKRENHSSWGSSMGWLVGGFWSWSIPSTSSKRAMVGFNVLWYMNLCSRPSTIWPNQPFRNKIEPLGICKAMALRLLKDGYHGRDVDLHRAMFALEIPENSAEYTI